jgi:2-polyprenyl-3-methyl-5-hydroxy-6-metoxy-1,4-benzoquinol methylase
MLMRFDVLLCDAGTLRDTEEFGLGLRELRRRVAAGRWWHSGPAQPLPSPAALLRFCTADALLVIPNPALLVSDNLVSELIAVLEHEGASCALPADPRDAPAPWQIDYASRPGFDRYAARREALPRRSAYAGQDPWIYLLRREALAACVAKDATVAWKQIPARLGTAAAIAQRAFVHSYANYQTNSRTEMLDLLPASVTTLLDVGGGEGGFGAAFVRARGGRAVLVEMNPEAAALAAAHGLEVRCTSFATLDETEAYDCVALLEVLEHLADPLAALQKAHRLLRAGGCVLLSVPNVGHWSVVRDLLEGEFYYQPVGILCNTHLRFFTRPGLERLLGDAGFTVSAWRNQTSPPPAEFADFLAGRAGESLRPDSESLSTESFHVLACRA